MLRDYLASVGKSYLAKQQPEIFSWITVHDSSASYHGRHYHRNHAMTAVLYLDVTDKTVRSFVQLLVIAYAITLQSQLDLLLFCLPQMP